MEYIKVLILFLSILIGLTPDTPLSSSRDEVFGKKYNNFELLSIKRKCQQNPHIMRVTPNTMVIIRSLRIQKTRKRGRRGGQNRGRFINLHSNKVNKNNLITVAPTGKLNNDKYCRIALWNSRSILKKDKYLALELENNWVDICAITETWIKPNEDHNAWIQGTDLNNNQWQISSLSRENRSGGGVALVFNHLRANIQLLDKDQNAYMEHGLWKVYSNSSSMTIWIIYHPPTSKNSLKNYHQAFIDKFCEYYADYFSKYNNLIILGGF